MLKTLHVVDPLLVNQGGHYLSQHVALWNLCRRFGFDMVSYVDVGFDETLMPSGVQVRKVFGASVIPGFDGHYCVEMGLSNLKCYADLKQLDISSFGSDDILFITSVTSQFALAYGRWLRDVADSISCRVALYTIISSEVDDTLGRDIRRNGVWIDDPSFDSLDTVVVPNELKRSMYRYLIDSIPSASSGRYKIFYEEPFASRVFLDLCSDPAVEFVYLHSMYPGEQPEITDSANEGKVINVSFLGSGGLGDDSKGGHLMADIVRRFSGRQELSWTVHLGYARSVGGVTQEQLLLASELEALENVLVRRGMLGCDDYCSLIENTNIMLLPYGPRYRHIMSGIFDDSIFLGKVCVIPVQSKMALWMERHNLEYPGFVNWSEEGVGIALEKAVSNFDYYQRQFRAAQKICHERWDKKNPISVFIEG